MVQTVFESPSAFSATGSSGSLRWIGSCVKGQEICASFAYMMVNCLACAWTCLGMCVDVFGHCPLPL